MPHYGSKTLTILILATKTALGPSELVVGDGLGILSYKLQLIAGIGPGVGRPPKDGLNFI